MREAARHGLACLDRDVATVWPSYALLPLLLSFFKPHSVSSRSSLALSVFLYLHHHHYHRCYSRSSQRATSRTAYIPRLCVPSREFVIYEARKLGAPRGSTKVSASPGLSFSLRPFRPLLAALTSRPNL